MDAAYLTTAQVRAVDRLAGEKYHIPSILLMEHAAIALFAETARIIEQEGLKGVLVLVGPGNNGGDGLALARHLHNADIPVQVVVTREPDQYRGDARINLEIAKAMGIAIRLARSTVDVDQAVACLHRPVVVVDALLGTGVDRPLSGFLSDLVRWINGTPRGLVLAVDVPSGMDSDRGPVLGPCVRADVTVTFVARKTGFRAAGSSELLGRVVVGQIGAPPELIRAIASGHVDPGG